MRGPDSAPRTSWLALLAVACAAIGADQATKAIVRARVPFGESIDGLGPFAIHHVRNSGIAHGLLQGTAPVLAVLTGLVVVGMVVYFARGGSRGWGAPVAFGLLVGGSVGNLIDRARLGYVTDFVDPDRGGTFNLADAAITVGLAILLVSLLAGRRPAPARPPGASA